MSTSCNSESLELHIYIISWHRGKGIGQAGGATPVAAACLPHGFVRG